MCDGSAFILGAEECEIRGRWGVDVDWFCGCRMDEAESGGAEQHAGVAELFGDAGVVFHVAIKIIADDGVAGELEMLADLMVAPRVRGGFDDGDVEVRCRGNTPLGAIGDLFEKGERRAGFFGLGSAERGVGLPVFLGFSVDDGAIGFGDGARFEEVMHKAQAVFR